MAKLRIDRIWDMPNADTMLVPSIRSFTLEYLAKSKVSVDPFARNCRLATYTNDLNPDTAAEYHMDAIEFLNMLRDRGVMVDLAIFDPPYSPRQISECYQHVGRAVTMEDTQGVGVWSHARNALADIVQPGGVVLSYGWNSTGMGIKHRFMQERILLVSHSGAHNDTICVAERRLPDDATLFGQPELLPNDIDW